MISLSAISELALGELPDAYDNSVADAFRLLLQDPEARLIYLVEFSPFNNTLAQELIGEPPISTGAIGEFDTTFYGGVDTIYISDDGYITTSSDTPASTNYLPLTSNPLQFDASIFSGDSFRGGSPSFGSIKILNGDAENDNLVDYFWEGRSAKVYAGSHDFTRDQFTKIFDGISTILEHNEDEIIVNISDRSGFMDNPIVQDIYGGTGSTDGSDDIANTVKPLLYGQCYRIEPVLVDAANLIYQIHDGAMQSVDAVYDRGVALSSGGDVADIVAASVSAGQYKTQLSGGYIKLGSTPDGRITVDAKGDSSGSYVNTIADISQRIVTTKLGANSLTSDYVDAGSFNTFDASVTGVAGIYIKDTMSARQILDSLIVSVQGYWTFDRIGRITVGVLDAPDVEDYELTESEIQDIQCINTIQPAWRIRLGYAHNWSVQNEDDIAAAATTAYREFAPSQYRTAIYEDRSIRIKTAKLFELEFESQLLNSADATTEVTRIGRLYSEKRNIYRIKVMNLLFRVFIGDTIKVTMSRFGLDSGRNFIITGISEDVETGITTLEVWG